METIPGLAFIAEIDKLKNILRQTLLHDESRRENSAEHSWHLATAVLAGHGLANEKINLERALKIALIHDIVEIDAVVTFVYDEVLAQSKAEREQRAAERIFALLPAEIGAEFRALWDTYEEQACPESKFVGSFDRLLPMLANFRTQGHSWKKHGITSDRVLKRNASIQHGSEQLWAYAQDLVAEAVRLGYLSK